MFNAERMLGSLVKGALRGSTRNVSNAAIGMGLLGVAIAAVEHYSAQGRQPGTVPPPPPQTMPPPPPPAQVPPPPLPPESTSSVNPAVAPSSPERDRALLLVRTMIAAAASDGVIDESERARIVSRAGTLDEEDRDALERELAAPLTLEELVAGVSPGEGEEVYAAALLAITVDTLEERQWLQRLSLRLGLGAEAVERLHRLFGVTP